jgi:nitroreductase
MLRPEVQHTRTPTQKIDPLFVNRWSPRSMTGEELSDNDLMSLFEAARWAPSSFNNQPWRFIFAKRNSLDWTKFLNLLNDTNRLWSKDAAVLIVVLSRKTFEHNGKPSITHQFDAGAAWENLALEASLRGFVAHGMQGFDYEKARRELEVPNTYDIMAMIAVGKRGPREKLPPELQEKEFPKDRKPLSEIVMEGRFKENDKTP